MPERAKRSSRDAYDGPYQTGVYDSSVSDFLGLGLLATPMNGSSRLRSYHHYDLLCTTELSAEAVCQIHTRVARH